MKSSHRPTGARKQMSTHNPKITEGYFKTFDGTKIYYCTEGEGEPLVFCYGLVCSSLHWAYQINHFSKKYKTIWMDYRGHQRSEMPKNIESISLDFLAKDLKQLFDHLGLEKATILGHSMGVNVVLEFYRQYPEHVEALVLTSGTPTRPLETLLLSNTLEPGFALLELLSKKFPSILNKIWKLQKNNPLIHAVIGKLGFNTKQTPAKDIALYVDQIADLEPNLFLKLIRDYDRYECTSWLHEITKPTLVLAGEKDLVVPLSRQELLHQLISKSTLEIIQEGSHCPQMDFPDIVNNKIEQFLKKIKN